MPLVPHPDYRKAATLLTDYHLALSLRRVKTVHDGILWPKGFSTNRAVALWRDTPAELIHYGQILRQEACSRRLPDPKDHSWMSGTGHVDNGPPFWLGITEWHEYHRGVVMGHAVEAAVEAPDIFREPVSPLQSYWHVINHL